MTFNLIELITILFTHWVADFICQSSWQATNKSKDNAALTSHVAIYAGVFFFPMLILFGCYTIPASGNEYLQAFSFIMITFICHWITDYFTSRLNSILWAKKDYHWFFVSYSADQLIHYFQLLLTYIILKEKM